MSLFDYNRWIRGQWARECEIDGKSSEIPNNRLNAEVTIIVVLEGFGEAHARRPRVHWGLEICMETVRM